MHGSSVAALAASPPECSWGLAGLGWGVGGRPPCMARCGRSCRAWDISRQVCMSVCMQSFSRPWLVWDSSLQALRLVLVPPSFCGVSLTRGLLPRYPHCRDCWGALHDHAHLRPTALTRVCGLLCIFVGSGRCVSRESGDMSGDPLWRWADMRHDTAACSWVARLHMAGATQRVSTVRAEFVSCMVLPQGFFCDCTGSPLRARTHRMLASSVRSYTHRGLLWLRCVHPA